ncbi:MAG: hypothetical protein ABI895_35420 [Deltaproteobacteria bacterium]
MEDADENILMIVEASGPDQLGQAIVQGERGPRGNQLPPISTCAGAVSRPNRFFNDPRMMGVRVRMDF